MDWGREGIGHAADLVKGREIARHLCSRGKFQANIYYRFIPCPSKSTFPGGAVSGGKGVKCLALDNRKERWTKDRRCPS